MNVPIVELKTQYRQIQSEVQAAIEEVFDASWFILGKQVSAFEEEFAEFCGARFAVGVGSGTEALHLALLALGVRPGDEVITVPNTAVATVSALSFAQATPMFVDVHPTTCLMDVSQVEAKITQRTRAIVPVHLYGHPVDLAPLLEVAQRHGLVVVEDAAQAHGAVYRGRRLGAHGNAVCFSFYPSKNLGAYGDGGAVTTNDESMRDQLIMLRNYGERQRYYHEVKGFNSRLDEIQAAILRVKLRHLERWNQRRREIAEHYEASIRHPYLELPMETPGAQHCWHLFVIRTDERAGLQARDHLRAHLAEHGVSTQIHYPVPIHLQVAYSDLGFCDGAFPIAESLARRILSLPMYPEMTDEQVNHVAHCVNRWEAACD